MIKAFFWNTKQDFVLEKTFKKITTDTYAATLATCIFWIFIALITTFDFEIRQLDTINVFANNFINKPIYCKMLESFGIKSINIKCKFFLFCYVFYRLK